MNSRKLSESGAEKPVDDIENMLVSKKKNDHCKMEIPEEEKYDRKLKMISYTLKLENPGEGVQISNMLCADACVHLEIMKEVSDLGKMGTLIVDCC